MSEEAEAKQYTEEMRLADEVRDLKRELKESQENYQRVDKEYADLNKRHTEALTNLSRATVDLDREKRIVDSLMKKVR